MNWVGICPHIITVVSATASDLYLKLEDVTRHFVKPCIMDVKLGQRSYDPFASQEKREQQIRKYPLMEEIGFLVLGMRVSLTCGRPLISVMISEA